MQTLEDSQAITVQAEAEGAVEETPVTASTEGEVKPEPSLNPAEILSKLESLEKQTKSFQSEKDKTVAELGRTKKEKAELEREIATLKATFDGLRGDLGDDPELLDRLKRRSTEAELEAFRKQKEAEKQAEAEKLAQAQKAREFFSELGEDLEEYGLTLEDERLIKVGKTVQVGDWRGLRRAVIKEAKRISKGDNTVKDTTYDALQAEIDNLKKQLGMQSTEALPPVSAGGGGRVFTAKEIDKMSPAEYGRNREAILAAQKEGRIK